MQSLSKKQLAYSRSIQAHILQGAASHKRCHLAQHLNVDTTTIGRWLDCSHTYRQPPRTVCRDIGNM